MGLEDLEPNDRRVAVAMSLFATALLVGLTVTGVWEFMTHEPKSSWDRYQVGGDSRPLPQPATGVADVHGVLGDVAAVTTLVIGAWVSYRLLAKVSLTAVAALVLLGFAIVSGGFIAFNALANDGVVELDRRGYFPVFLGDVDLMITDTNDLSRGVAMAWTSLHIITMPVIVALAWLPLRRAKVQRANAPIADPSWLDQL